MPPQMQAEILGNYISRNLPKATIAILSQLDYVGAQFLTGFYTRLGMEHARSAFRISTISIKWDNREEQSTLHNDMAQVEPVPTKYFKGVSRATKLLVQY